MNPRKASLLKIFLFLMCVLLLLGAWLAFGRQGLIHLYRTERDRQAHVARILKLAEENRALLKEIKRLSHDMDYLASVARTELNLIKKNEIIYRFEGDDILPVQLEAHSAEEKTLPQR